MRPSGQLVTSDTIKFQWRLPEPVLPADHPMLTAPILPMLVRFSVPNMMAMLAMALVAISRGGTGHDGDVILQKSGGRGNASAQVASSRAVRAVRQSNDGSAAASEGAISRSSASGTTIPSMRRSVISSAAARAA